MRQRFFYQNLSITAGLGPFKKYNFYATLWRYFAGEFFDLKNSINRQINGDLGPLKGFGINFLGLFGT